MPWLWARRFESRVGILRCRPEEWEDTVGNGAADFERKEVFDMPGFDGTGPAGMGPMTGGGRGFCNPSSVSPGWSPGYYGRGFGRGYGRGPGYGRGLGFGRGRGYWGGFGWRGAYPPSGGWYGPTYGPAYGNPYNVQPEDEIRGLKDEAKYMKDELDAINKRIEELKTETSET
jgi:hypothetical protein